MKRLLVMLVTVVLSLPLLSFSGSESSIGHTKSTVGKSKRNRNNSGTLTVATGTATASVTTVQATTQPTGLNPPGFGTPTLDGVMSPGEWDNAVKIEFDANIPPSEGGGTTPATLFIMNDSLKLYLAVKVARSSFGYQTQLTVDFDNNNKGIPVDGDDSFQMVVGNALPALFVDTYRFTCPGAPAGSAGCNVQDTNQNGGILPAGSKDGDGFATNDGSFTIIEVSKTLSSTDVLHDFSLKPGSKVGYHAVLGFTVTATNTIGPLGGQIGGPGPIGVTYSYAETPVPATQTGSYYGQITITSPVVTQVIHIRPMNSINWNSKGKIPVAILSGGGFDAPGLVDRETLTFGRTGDEKSLAFCNEGSEDVNGDGLPDMICHFKTHIAGFQSDDKAGTLNGKTKEGVPFTATDPVRIVR